MNIFVGNLSRDTVEKDVRLAFEDHGHVMTVRIVKDAKSGISKGFAFVEMPFQADAERAVLNLNGSKINGCKVKIQGTRPQT